MLVWIFAKQGSCSSTCRDCCSLQRRQATGMRTGRTLETEFVQIIGGTLKGLTIDAGARGDRSGRVRPTTSRVRTSIFDLLEHGSQGNRLFGARALDLFAGTGALGIEAISRGACFTTFVDKSATACRLISGNIRKAGIRDVTMLTRADATRLGRCPDARYNLVFLDPPYEKGLAKPAIHSALAGQWLDENALVVSEGHEPLRMPGYLKPITERKYGSTWVVLACQIHGFDHPA